MTVTIVDKVKSPAEALSVVRDGQSIMVGGFGLVGTPLVLLDALSNTSVRDLTIISNNLGEPGKGLGRLLANGQVRRAIGSYFTSNPEAVRAYTAGKLDIVLMPQGTFAEAIRAGGAGIGGFYTPVSAGTQLAVGLEVRIFDGLEYVLQTPLKADVALIRAHRADRLGNLTYYKTARNFNPIMATAADYVVAEVDEVVEVGTFDPDEIITPHLFVDALVLSNQPARVSS